MTDKPHECPACGSPVYREYGGGDSKYRPTVEFSCFAAMSLANGEWIVSKTECRNVTYKNMMKLREQITQLTTAPEGE